MIVMQPGIRGGTEAFQLHVNDLLQMEVGEIIPTENKW